MFSKFLLVKGFPYLLLDSAIKMLKTIHKSYELTKNKGKLHLRTQNHYEDGFVCETVIKNCFRAFKFTAIKCIGKLLTVLYALYLKYIFLMVNKTYTTNLNK